MKFWMNFLLIFVLVMSLPMSTGAQSQSKPDQDVDKIVTGTTEVALDIVVRDKNGRPVRDLQASDFNVYEDGVRQGIESFRLVERQPATGGAEVKAGVKREDTVTRPTQAPTRDPFAQSSFIAMVFDRLSPNARNLAHKAAVNYVAESVKPDDLVGVFSIDLSLRTLQSYTANADLVRQAVDRAASLSTSTFASGAGQVRTLSDRQSALQSATQSSEATAAAGGRDTGAAANAAGSAIGAGMAEGALNQMMMNMLQTYETLERDQQGYATTNGLMAIINSLRSRSGRKAIIFFSEGLAIPPAVQAHFRSVINTANRANVSIYAIDAAGLRVESPNAETAREITSWNATKIC
jgi:VWFA-related protein